MKLSQALPLALLLALGATRADAQQVSLSFVNGLVTLDARNVPVGQVLTEWARVGGVRIVNGEKVLGPVVSLQLAGVPERQALDILLRNVSGYLLAARPAGGQGASSFDRIFLLPSSSAPRAAAPPPAAPRGFSQPGITAPVQIPEPGEPDTDQAENRVPEPQAPPQFPDRPTGTSRPPTPTFVPPEPAKAPSAVIEAPKGSGAAGTITLPPPPDPNVYRPPVTNPNMGQPTSGRTPPR